MCVCVCVRAPSPHLLFVISHFSHILKKLIGDLWMD